jgi:hypothetical protein
LAEAGLSVVEQVATMDDAARRAAELAATGPGASRESVTEHGAGAPATGA